MRRRGRELEKLSQETSTHHDQLRRKSFGSSAAGGLRRSLTRSLTRALPGSTKGELVRGPSSKQACIAPAPDIEEGTATDGEEGDSSSGSDDDDDAAGGDGAPAPGLPTQEQSIHKGAKARRAWIERQPGQRIISCCLKLL